MRILVINGPNLNLLGTREPTLYGTDTLANLAVQWQERAALHGANIETFQSNHEGAIVDAIQDAAGRFDGLVINAGALTHYSYSLRDAVTASGLVAVEVHISNVHEREEWRHFSVLSDVCDLTIVGRGTVGYLDAINHLIAAFASPALTVSYSDHENGVLDLRVPDGQGPHPVALLIHGGFWRDIWKRDLMDPMAVALVTQGWATANMEYTRGVSSYSSAVADVNRAVEWITANASEQQLDIGSIVAIGHSAGGYLALRLAHDTAALAAAVPLAAVTDLASMAASRPEDDPVHAFLGSPQSEAPRLWEQAELVGEPSAPIHLLHGADDDDVAPSQSSTYMDLHKDLTRMTLIDDCDHMKLIDPHAESWSSLVAALAQVRAQ
jgi:3-dehydroquinate dehydratase-2